MSDSQALDAIRDLLDGVAWTPATLERIAEIVAATGRTVKDI